MGLFDKKFCDICGEKISLLGNRKLEDGNMCSACAKLISPFMTDRRRTTVEEMKEHLAYRDSNRQAVAAFNVSSVFGEGKKIYVDRSAGNFIVSRLDPNGWDKENPDVIPISQVTSCVSDVKETKEELFTKDSEGNKKSFSPPRYSYHYDFYIKITVNNRWFSDIDTKLNNEYVQNSNTARYRSYETVANQVIEALTSPAPVASSAPVSNRDDEMARAAALTASVLAETEAAKAAGLQRLQAGDLSWMCINCMTKNTGKFCTGCGAKRPERVDIKCPNCGWMPGKDEKVPKFCINCGTPITTDAMIG